MQTRVRKSYRDLVFLQKCTFISGLILYNGQQKGGSGDFVSLGLNQGFVEFKFDVGSGTATIKNNRPLTMGQWHTVKLTRSRKDGQFCLVLDRSRLLGSSLGKET